MKTSRILLTDWLDTLPVLSKETRKWFDQNQHTDCQLMIEHRENQQRIVAEFYSAEALAAWLSLPINTGCRSENY